MGSYFNPRTHEECDLVVAVPQLPLSLISIHALTKSATICQSLGIKIFFLFQSTHSRRVRLLRPNGKDTHYIFQSTHSRRVRRNLLDLTRLTSKFQSTHSRRVRQFVLNNLLCLSGISIHALTKSATADSYGRGAGM